MSNTENNPSEFKDKTEALEFMVQRSIDKKRKEKWAKEFKNAKKKSESSKVISLQKRLLQISAVAAVLVGVLVVVQFVDLNPSNLDGLASNMIENTKFKPQELTRGVVMSEEELDRSLVKALEDENYDEALTLYQQKSNSFTTEDKFFYAVSLAKTNSNQDEKILELTSDVMKSENEFFIESLWLSALTNIKLNNTEKAKSELEKLLRYKYQTKNVKRLLDKISS